MKELIKYHTRKYFHSNKIVMPFLFWVIFLKVSYSETGLYYVDNIVMSMGILFFVMIWIGYSYQDLESPISEQLLILKLRSFNFYYFSKVLFLFIIGVIFSIIGIGFPIIQNVCNNFLIFRTAITFEDIFWGIILHSMVAFMGTIVGSFFHPAIVNLNFQEK